MSAAADIVRPHLTADRDQIAQFVDGLFRYADAGYVSLRSFDQFDHTKAPLNITPVNFADREFLVSEVTRVAEKMANGPTPAVFAPPIATFSNRNGAKTSDLANGLTISLELDSGNTTIARQRLEGILGLVTIAMASGGEWTDPNTGELFPKLHLHWRLTEPTRTPIEHEALRQVRDMACRLVEADPTGKPVCHPLRWPGSWNVKAAPRMARIVTYNPAAEINLPVALSDMEGAIELAGLNSVGMTESGTPEADPVLVASAMAAIANPGTAIGYDEWVKFGYALWRATGGTGYAVFDEWSAKSDKYVSAETEAVWRRIGRSIRADGPTTIRTAGAGTIFHRAKAENWIDPRATAPPLPSSADDYGSIRSRTRQTPPPSSRDSSPGTDNAEPDADPPPPSDGPPPDIDDPAYHAAQEAGPTADACLITEGTVAEAFAAKHADSLRYDHSVGKWFIWTGTHWRKDLKKQAYHWAYKLASSLAASTDEAKIIIAASKAAFASGVERLAQCNPVLAVTSEIWDADPWLLGTPAGTLNLKTGIIRPAQRSDFITKLTAVGPAETPDCPQWLAFLDQASGINGEYIRFLQQWCGYCLTGSIREHAFLFLHGPGGNGKGVWMNTVANILGDYCTTAAMDTFIASKGERHPTDLAALKGARMVCASETEEGRQWAEVRIKQVTGGDRISARFMRQDFFEFMPQFKLTIIGNHQPELRNVDDAARRRVNMGPFLHKPPKPDKDLEEKMKPEWLAILRWMIDGCLDWQANGLVRPAVVAASTAEYFDDQDLLTQWIEECCERTDQDGLPLADTIASLLASWRGFAKGRGEDFSGSKGFSNALQKRGFSRIRDKRGIRGRGILGIKVRVHFEPPPDRDDGR